MWNTVSSPQNKLVEFQAKQLCLKEISANCDGGGIFLPSVTK